MNLREKMENHAVVVALTLVLSGFAAGVSTMMFVDSMEQRIHDKVVDTLGQ